MAEQLNEFLEKIQKEAVGKAAEQAEQKLAQAKAEADKIVSDARAEAEKIIAEAEAKAKQFAENGEKTLRFASRDVLTYTRQELENLLKKVFAEKAAEVLKLEDIKPIILKLAANCEGDVVIEVPEGSDVEKLQNYFMSELAGKAKGGVKVCPVKGLKAGASVVSVNGDLKIELSDETLVELLSSQLSPKLAAVLRD
jgi:V/A-type H+-transporting ATPase subunit E